MGDGGWGMEDGGGVVGDVGGGRGGNWGLEGERVGDLHVDERERGMGEE